MQRPHFDDAAEKQGGVEDDHDGIVVVAKFLAAVGQSPAGISFGDQQLDEPFNTDGQDQQVIHGLPAQKHEFGGETRPHGDHQPNRPR